MDSPEMMDVEEKLGMSLDELIFLDAHGGPGHSLLQELRTINDKLSPEEKLCMSLDDILVHSKAHTRRSAHEGSPRTCQRPRRRTYQVTHLRRIYFPPPHYGWDRCRRCLRSGHATCDSPLACFACGKAGHRAFQCMTQQPGVFLANEAYEPAGEDGSEGGGDSGGDESEQGEDAYAEEVTLSDLCSRRSSQPTLSDLCAPPRWPPPGFAYHVGEEVERDEDRCHEFKSTLPPRPSGLERYLNAFANTKGGKLVVGVADDGSVRGVRFGRAHRDELRLECDAIAKGMQPPLGPGSVKVNFVPCLDATRTPELFVLVVRVKRDAVGLHLHYTRAGDLFTRENGSVRKLAGLELQRVIEEKALDRERRRRRAKRASRGTSSTSSDDYSSSADGGSSPRDSASPSLSASPRRRGREGDDSEGDSESSEARGGSRPVRQRVTPSAGLPSVREEEEEMMGALEL